MWIRVSVAALIVALCMSAAPAFAQLRIISRVELGSAAWADLLGLTQDEIRAKLGLRQTDETSAEYGSSLKDGKVVVETNFEFLIPSGICLEPSSPGNRRVFLEISHDLKMTFEDGHLTKLKQLSFTGSPAPLNQQILSIVCVTGEVSPDSSNAKNAPWLKPFGFLFSHILDANDAQYHRETTELADAVAELKLGQPPPGGSNAWVARRSKLAMLVSLNGEIAIRFRYGGSAHPNTTEAKLKNGLVVAINPEGLNLCMAQKDRSLRCEQSTERRARVFVAY